MTYISFSLASLRVDSIKYSCFPTTCYLWPLTLESFFFFCQIVSSYSFKLLLLILWPAPNSSVILWGILLILETLFVPWGHSSMGVFQSLTQIVSSLLPHVSCHYCYGTLNTNNFYFLFFYFSWFYFSFSLFYFPGKTMKQACDKKVTWQVTWCDVTSLEHDGRV